MSAMKKRKMGGDEDGKALGDFGLECFVNWGTFDLRGIRYGNAATGSRSVTRRPPNGEGRG
jgi:hypothetical protein